MKTWIRSGILMAMFAAVLAFATTPAMAQKGGKGNGGGNGGGGGGGGGDPVETNLPPFSYSVDTISVDGMLELKDFNDYGQALIYVDGDELLLELGDYINGNGDVINRGPAVVDTNGVELPSGSIDYPVTYIDLNLSPEDAQEWSILVGEKINNQGQILARGINQNGDREALMLIPDADTETYDIITFDSLPASEGFPSIEDLSDQGIGLCRVDTDYYLLSPVGAATLLTTANYSPRQINDAGLLFGTFGDSEGYAIGEGVVDTAGNVFELEVPEGFESYKFRAITLLSNTNFVSGTLRLPPYKSRGSYVTEERPVYWDLSLVAALGYAPAYELPLRPGVDSEQGPNQATDQVVDGQPVLVDLGVGRLYYPGYDVAVISDDLMDETQQAILQTVIGSSAGISGRFTTPRLADGSPDNLTPPPFYGPWGYHTVDGVGYYEGIFRGIGQRIPE